MSERGVFAVDRGIFDHPVLNSREPFSRREAWLWLLSEAAWKPRSFRSQGKQIELKRGQLSHSVRFLADKWGWSKSAVGRFLDVLQTETMIEKESGTGQVVITICNYDQFQRVSLPTGTATGTQIGTEAGQQRDKEEDIKGIESNSDSGGLFADQPAGKKPRKHEWPRDYRDQFWNAYPYKQAKKTALEVLDRIRAADKTPFQEILDGIETYRRTKPPDRDWMLPTTFLRNERWNDEPSNQHPRQSNGYQQQRRESGAEAITAGVRAATDAILGRDRNGADFAEGFDTERPGPGDHSQRDLELPYRVIGAGSRS